MTHLDLRLEVNVGASPLRFGMSMEEAAEIMQQWGTVTVNSPIEPGELRMNTRFNDYSRDIYANFEDGLRVTSIEVWRPTRAGDLTVSFEGIDIFGANVDDVLNEIQSHGHVLDDSVEGFPGFPAVALWFNADFMDHDDDDEDDSSYHFANVRIARPELNRG